MQKEGGFGAVRVADGVPGSGSRSSVASSDRPCPFLFSSSLSTTLRGCLLPALIDGVEGSSSGVASRGNSDCSGAREGGAVEEEDAAEETAPRSDAPCASSCESIAAVVRLSEKRELRSTRARRESVREKEQKEERACRERRGDKAARHEMTPEKKRAAALALLTIDAAASCRSTEQSSPAR